MNATCFDITSGTLPEIWQVLPTPATQKVPVLLVHCSGSYVLMSGPAAHNICQNPDLFRSMRFAHSAWNIGASPLHDLSVMYKNKKKPNGSTTVPTAHSFTGYPTVPSCKIK